MSHQGLISGELLELVGRWRELKQTHAGRGGEDHDALRAMSHEGLARLAYDALEALTKLEPFAYQIAMTEIHAERPHEATCAWVVAQKDKNGGYNKFAKILGGYFPESGPLGDALVFQEWKDARDALQHMHPELRQYSAIFPVVVTAGREPRVTEPVGG